MPQVLEPLEAVQAAPEEQVVLVRVATQVLQVLELIQVVPAVPEVQAV